MTETATEDQGFIGKFTQPLLELIRQRLDGDGRHATYWHINWFQDAEAIGKIGIIEERYLVMHLNRLVMEGYITYERKQKNEESQNWIAHVVAITGAGRQYLIWQEQRLRRFCKKWIVETFIVGLLVGVIVGLLTAWILSLFQGQPPKG